MWPFSHQPGDCLTDNEKKNGQTGVYGGAAAVMPVSQTVNQTGAVNQAGTMNQAAAMPASMTNVQPSASTPATAETCHKGWLWPFSRQRGDCLTDAEKKAGHTGVYGDP